MNRKAKLMRQLAEKLTGTESKANSTVDALKEIVEKDIGGGQWRNSR